MTDNRLITGYRRGGRFLCAKDDVLADVVTAAFGEVRTEYAAVQEITFKIIVPASNSDVEVNEDLIANMATKLGTTKAPASCDFDVSSVIKKVVDISAMSDEVLAALNRNKEIKISGPLDPEEE